jgi:predicted TIM-barrel fold metal-dependent hydrolase
MSTASTFATASSLNYLPVRQDWLDRRKEPILEPDLPIVDPHHHLWVRPDWRYLLDELVVDTNSGHNIVATVFVQARAMVRGAGPVEMRPVGETEFVNGVAAMSASGIYGKTRHCAGIVGHADLTLGGRVELVLAAHIRAGGDRFRGIRHISAWDADASIRNPVYSPPPGLLGDKTFREGFAILGRLGLSFDAWLYHPQIDELADLARVFPETKIGGPIGTGTYAGKHKEVLSGWTVSIKALSACPNVYVKLGGLGMRLGGFGLHEQSEPPSSETLAATWRPYIETCINAFGPSRSMFESNFPVDKGSYSYPVFWNACKLLTKGASDAEKADLFSGTATRFYALIFSTDAIAETTCAFKPVSLADAWLVGHNIGVDALANSISKPDFI